MPVGTPGFVPERLIEARDARRISSKSALARKLKINPSTVSRWEDGISAPDPETLRVLADELGVRPEFFLRPAFINEKPTFLRSFASARVRDLNFQQVQMKWLQEVSNTLERYVEFPEVDVPDMLGKRHYRQLDEDDLETIALDLRTHWGIGDGPCVDVVGLMERVGFIVGVMEMGTAKLDGLCSWSPVDGRPHVLLSSDKECFARRQMDAAHEMSHAILHRNVTQAELQSDLQFIEAQAFRLASAFLMPQTTFATEVPLVTLTSLQTMKQRWRVSIKAQIHRLKELEIIDPEHAVHLYKMYSAKGWSKNEPYDDIWQPAKPRALKEAIELIVNENERSKTDLMTVEFTISPNDVEKLTGLPDGWFGFKSAEIVTLKRSVNSSEDQTDQAALVLELFPNRPE